MEISDVDQEDTALSILEDVEQDIDLWVELRRQTVAELREIADYIETVTKDCGIAKVRNNCNACYFSLLFILTV